MASPVDAWRAVSSRVTVLFVIILRRLSHFTLITFSKFFQPRRLLCLLIILIGHAESLIHVCIIALIDLRVNKFVQVFAKWYFVSWDWCALLAVRLLRFSFSFVLTRSWAVLIATFWEKYGLFSSSTLSFIIFVSLSYSICNIETMLGAIHSRIDALLNNTKWCSTITIFIIEAGIARFAPNCRLLMRTTIPAFIAHLGVVLCIIITLSLLTFIFTVHVNYRRWCLEHFRCRMWPQGNFLPIA